MSRPARRSPACSTSIGSRRIACVPTMTSATPGDRLRSASPSCCATQPATATIGSCPCSAASCAQLAEARVQLLLGALAHAARVDDDDVGVGGVVGRLEAGLLEQPGHALGVVDVHLAAERLDQVFTRHALVPFAFASFAFAFRLRFRLSPSRPPPVDAGRSRPRASRGPTRRRPSVTARPAEHPRSSSTRPSLVEPAARSSASGRARRASRSGSACRRTRQSAAGA